jgi:hypothetical protein
MAGVWCQTAILVLLTGRLLAQEMVIVSGDARLILSPDPAGDSHHLRFEHSGRSMRTYAPEKPLSLEVDGKRIDGTYATVSREDGMLVCQGTITTGIGSQFLFTDRYRPAR